MLVWLIYFRGNLHGVYGSFDKALEHYKTLDPDWATYPTAMKVIN